MVSVPFDSDQDCVNLDPAARGSER